jgi:tetratricopeptide (TPR) repeat protein
MGEVWLAEQTEPVRRQVALKVIKLGMDSAQVVVRFEAERQALALMDHPTIATVFDGGTTPQGRPYFAMEYVRGEPITVYCDRHRLDVAARLDLFIRVCEGVQHAHQKGVIHRDLKPSNVLVTILDDRAVPKIIDFGVAKATARQLTERTLFTELGVLIGTPEYMSPEQAEMSGLDIDTRADIYALGVLLYELLTGTLPFDREGLRRAGLAEMQRVIREEEPLLPSKRVTQLGPASGAAAKNRQTEVRRLVSELRGDLDWIAMRALEKDRTRRYGTATDLANDVRRYLQHEPVAAGPPSAAYRARKFVQRHRAGVAAAALLLVLLAGFAVAMGIQAERVRRERDRANQEAARANREAAAAAAVADFLTGLFRVSDPAQARGREVTAREVLDKGAARIDAELAGDPALRVRLLTTMGDVYRNLAALDRAEELVARAAATGRDRLGPEAPETLRASSLLGVVYETRGKTAEAEKLLSSVLALERRVLGPDHPNTLKTLANLANVYDSQGRYDESEPLKREVFERRRKVLGPDHLDTLGSQYNLAVSAYRAGRFEEAERILLEVRAVFVRVAGPDHPNTLVSEDLLGTVYVELGKLADARRCYEEAYQARRRILGPEHMDTLGSQLGLANVARREGRFEEAESLFRETLAVQERTLGGDHIDAISTRASLATLLNDAGRYDQAERVWRDDLARMERALGADHPDTANCLVGLAIVEVHRGRREAALQMLARAVHVDPRWAGWLSEQQGLKPLAGNPEFEKMVGSARHETSASR